MLSLAAGLSWPLLEQKRRYFHLFYYNRPIPIRAASSMTYSSKLEKKNFKKSVLIYGSDHMILFVAVAEFSCVLVC